MYAFYVFFTDTILRREKESGWKSSTIKRINELIKWRVTGSPSQHVGDVSASAAHTLWDRIRHGAAISPRTIWPVRRVNYDDLPLLFFFLLKINYKYYGYETCSWWEALKSVHRPCHRENGIFTQSGENFISEHVTHRAYIKLDCVCVLLCDPRGDDNSATRRQSKIVKYG